MILKLKKFSTEWQQFRKLLITRDIEIEYQPKELVGCCTKVHYTIRNDGSVMTDRITNGFLDTEKKHATEKLNV